MDFDRLEEFNGVMLANQVTNAEGVARGERPQRSTFISYDDGTLWRCG